jgi:hypothetical protein
VSLPLGPPRVKIAVATRDSGKCRRCGSAYELQHDHIVPYSRGHTEKPAGGRYDGAPVVVEDVRVMTDQIVTSGFTLLGVVVGLFEERWVRT